MPASGQIFLGAGGSLIIGDMVTTAGHKCWTHVCPDYTDIVAEINIYSILCRYQIF